MMDILSENNQKEYPKTVIRALKLQEKYLCKQPATS
jgi:hypothetical protein